MSLIRKALHILNKKQKGQLVFLFVLVLAGSGLELLGVSGVMPIVEVISDQEVIVNDESYVALGNIFSLETQREYVIFLAVSLIAIYIIKNLFLIGETVYQKRFTFRCQQEMACRAYSYYQNTDYLEHISYNVSDLQRNITVDISQTFSTILQFVQMCMEIFTGIFIILFLLSVDWISTLLLGVILGLLTFAFMVGFRRIISKNGAECRNLSSVQIRWINEGMGAFKEAKLAEKQNYFINGYRKAYGDYVNTQTRQAILDALPKPIMEMLSIGTLLGIVAVRIAMGEDMVHFLPVLTVFATSAFRMMPAFSRISGYISGIMYGKASVESVYEMTRCLEEKTERAEKKEATLDVFPEEGLLQIRDVSFQYPEAKEAVLERVSCEIKQNSSVALIGPSGGGKTTLANLILGLIEPQEGLIEFGGHCIMENMKAWHERIGFIPQAIFLLDNTIRRNIAFGLTDDEIEDEKIWKALEKAQLDQFVRDLPEGLDTMVGEQGVKLSGGQRQRIGIARALYTDPQLLILDEATSALDGETEAAVMAALENLQGKITMLIIAHRLTTIRKCDRVYRIENKVLEEVKKETLFDETGD